MVGGPWFEIVFFDPQIDTLYIFNPNLLVSNILIPKFCYLTNLTLDLFLLNNFTPRLPQHFNSFV
ncbi:hypothetical protein HanRHA438_Chr08g0334911 [Helianthus annuus]|nr:hypothetical protein HanRHA438_Chr08g0334911 [Helianthus annuus]